ncbi:hypothetical protein IQ249_00770 [Lusitaniella coriacea LEGE 07157]|uniref:Uncharacterized protein n=1 Tax=Lusitaniella coriacea LEGE 07157 TaxID=945747 RepID=A0A8J7B8E6_9CYAN|nr:hypothetical protein [Lusitaniella coriacea]MBE9114418.1 hypothetical protein [Lusitaniella coriacea LEGE 07157]
MLKKISWVLLILALSSFATLYYYWRQLTRVPEWYSAQTIESIEIPQTEAQPINFSNIRSKVRQKIAQSPKNSELELQLNAQQINELVVSSIAENPKGRELLKAAKGINTTINEDNVEIGMIVNTTELQASPFGSKEKVALNKILQDIPTLQNRDIYIGIESLPQVEGGRLQVDPNTQIKVGNLSFSIAEISQKLGVSPEKIIEKVNQNLDNLTVNDLTLEEDTVRITGSVN